MIWSLSQFRMPSRLRCQLKNIMQLHPWHMIRTISHFTTFSHMKIASQLLFAMT